MSDGLKAAADCTATSVELGRRAAQRAERRMLTGGELIEAASGAEFDNLSPVTGGVLGATAAAGELDMDRAIGAARAAFDVTDWSTNRAFGSGASDSCRPRSRPKKTTCVRNWSPRWAAR